MDERLQQMSETETAKRPTLSDPKEYALIKEIHFNRRHLPQSFEDIDDLERLDRMEHSKNRNQSR